MKEALSVENGISFHQDLKIIKKGDADFLINRETPLTVSID